jgi:secreted trypsin-like serine protease
MIIRHDIDPALYIVEPAQFPAIVAVDGGADEVLITYDNIDRLLKPSLIPDIELAPEMYNRCDGMGTLISPSWILTAAHVAIELSTDKTIKLNDQPYAIQQIVLHPGFINDLEGADISQIKNDIALIALTQPVTDVSPLPLYPKTDELNKITTLVGQGDYGNGLIGPDSVDTKTRIATNRIEKVSDQWLIFKFDAPPDTTEREGIAGPGDRGGPALIQTATGWAIAGISAAQDSGRLGMGCYGVWEYYTRVSQHVDWIESITQPIYQR